MPQKIILRIRLSTFVFSSSLLTLCCLAGFLWLIPVANGASVDHGPDHTPRTRNFRSVDSLIRQVMEYGLNASDYLFDVLEPRLYQQGQVVGRDDPSSGVAAFNFQQSTSKSLSRYGYASLAALSRLQEELLMSREDANTLSSYSPKVVPAFEDCPLKTGRIECPAFSTLYRTGDGSCNNVDHPEWGASFRPFQRFLPAAYSDGIESFRLSVTGSPLPSPRSVSVLVHQDKDIAASQFTTMLMQWGQFVDHDITSSDQTRGFNGSIPKCCHSDGQGELARSDRHPDCMPILVSEQDPFYRQFNVSCLNFVRSSPSPQEDCVLGNREQINQITSYMDASNVYGSTDKYLSSLRLYKGGKLKYKDMHFRKNLMPREEHPLENECRSSSDNMHCFKGGDSRVNEHPGLASMHTTWLREHNRLVTRLKALNVHWNDERLFHEARKIVSAQMQHITYNEWLPLILGERVLEVFDLRLFRRGFYYGYNDSVNPAAANAFATAAFRFGHSLIPKKLNRCNRHHELLPFHTSLRKELMDPTPIHNIGAVDRILLGMCSQAAMRRDEYIVEEVTNHLFETPNRPFGMDLMALNIQRGRDHGIPGYLAWREACGLTPIRNWGQLLSIMDDDTVGRLKIAYRHVRDIDLFPGGMAEKPVVGGVVGPTFACIIAQQFLNLRQGDRFWYENGDQPNSFTESQLREIRKVTLSRILCDNLDDIETLQPWVMLLPDEKLNPRVGCRGGIIPQMDLRAWRETDVRMPTLNAPIPTRSPLKFPTVERYDPPEDTEPKPVVEMPRPDPEDDWVIELPRPMKGSFAIARNRAPKPKSEDKATRNSAFRNQLF